MKPLQTWLDEYGESHRNKTNKMIHYICVPSIFLSIVGVLYTFNLNQILADVPLTAAHIALTLVIIYYSILSTPLSIGMILFSLFCLTVCNATTMVGLPLRWISIALFVVAWTGQFIGHHIEGKKPSFLKDIQFLLIGPAWIMSAILKRWNINP